MTRELELKFDLETGDGDLIPLIDKLASSTPRQEDQEAIYFDTEDGALRRRGFSLRTRRSGDRWIQTAKYRSAGSAGVFDRDEWESEIDGAELDLTVLDKTPIGKKLSGKLRRGLIPLIRTEVSRTSWRLTRDGSEVEITLDAGSMTAGKITTPISELEVELRNGEPAILFQVAEDLAANTTLRLGVLSKAERGYALVEGRFSRASKTDPVSVNLEMTTAAAFAAAAYSCLRHFRLNEGLVRQARDAAALHQTRISMRRLRSAFTLFGPVLRDRDYDHLRDELRWFTAQLGEARNIDVFMIRLPDADNEGESEVREKLLLARDNAYNTVVAALNSDRLLKLMLLLVRWIEVGEWRSRPKAAKPVQVFAAKQLTKRWRRIRDRGASLTELDPESLHELRIDVKKMRYSAEFLQGLHGAKNIRARRKAFVGALETIQEQLGNLNDAETAQHLVADLSLASPEADAFARPKIAKGPHRERALKKAAKAYDRLAAAADYWR